MKLVAGIKMLPTPEQVLVLTKTLVRCNEACSWIARLGFDNKVFRQYSLQKLAYRDVRARFGLSAQATILSVSKVTRSSLKGGMPAAPIFRSDAAQPYDDRILRFVQGGAAVNLWTIEGRIVVPIVMGEHQRRLMAHRKGEMDLCHIRGKWFLAATCEISEAKEFKAADWLGVDLGIVNLAVTSDGKVYTGENVDRARRSHAKRRSGLQRKRTKAAKRRLRKLSGRQARFQKHTNHCISKSLVLDAERTGRGLALENLKGIRDRVTARRSQRERLSNWGFAQLRAFLTYKAKRAGVPVVFVDPRNTSRECRECGHIDKANRLSQSVFLCVACGHQASADLNAARNVRARAVVMRPDVLVA